MIGGMKALKNNTVVTIETFQREMLLCKSLLPCFEKEPSFLPLITVIHFILGVIFFYFTSF